MAGRRRPNWKRLYRGWEEHQGRFRPTWELRFRVLLDVLEVEMPSRPRILDLGCGPGPLSKRVLARLPKASVVAVDVDPVVQRIGREVLGTAAGRLEWVRTDLSRVGWADDLPPGKFDAAVSTTALHWLRRRELGALYGGLGKVLKRSGVYLDSDYLPFGPEDGSLPALSRKVFRLYEKGSSPQWVRLWDRWWAAVGKMPELAVELAERRKKFSRTHPHEEQVPLSAHVRALERAGFQETGVVWSYFANRILFARR